MAAQRPNPRARKSEATRARLVAAAAEALLAGGGDFEMSQVARLAGVSDGLPYHYFGSKAGALSAVIDDFYDRYYAVVNQPLDGSRPWPEREFERLQAWLGFLYSTSPSRRSSSARWGGRSRSRGSRAAVRTS